MWLLFKGSYYSRAAFIYSASNVGVATPSTTHSTNHCPLFTYQCRINLHSTRFVSYQTHIVIDLCPSRHHSISNCIRPRRYWLTQEHMANSYSRHSHYSRAAFISVDICVGAATIQGLHLFEGCIYSRKYSN